MRFDYLSKNIIVLIDEILKNDKLIKYIKYNEKKPLSKDNLTDQEKINIVNDLILPTPFMMSVPEKQRTELRLFYGNGRSKNIAHLDSIIVFQIICHNDLWLIAEEDNFNEEDSVEYAIRPLKIMNEIVRTFNGKSIKTIGKIRFDNQDFRYRYISDTFGMYELFADIWTVGK